MNFLVAIDKLIIGGMKSVKMFIWKYLKLSFPKIYVTDLEKSL